jgi:small basic protein (TIGR04137 family)
MSIDRSLKLKDALVRHRNVLTRGERIQRLKDEERWEEGQSAFRLPKVTHRKSHAGRKAAKEKAAAVEGVAVTAESAAAPTAAPGATATPTGKETKEAKKGK